MFRNEEPLCVRHLKTPSSCFFLGLLFLIVHSAIEEKVAEKSFKEIEITNQSDKSWTEDEIERLQKKPWQLLEAGGLMPLKLSAAEKTLHPRFQSASLYIARRTNHRENTPTD